MREETELHDLTLPNVSYYYDNPQHETRDPQHETRHGDTDSHERDIHRSQYRQEQGSSAYSSDPLYAGGCGGAPSGVSHLSYSHTNYSHTSLRPNRNQSVRLMLEVQEVVSARERGPRNSFALALLFVVRVQGAWRP
eukprot:4798877-Pyramimonas_sp.AAC.1